MVRKRLMTYTGVVVSTPEFKELRASGGGVKMILFRFCINGSVYNTLVITGNSAITQDTLHRGSHLRVVGKRSRFGELYATAAEFIAPATREW